jgi:hypothetical protein
MAGRTTERSVEKTREQMDECASSQGGKKAKAWGLAWSGGSEMFLLSDRKSQQIVAWGLE